MSSLTMLDIQPCLADPSGRQASEFVEQLSDHGDNWLKSRVRSHPDVAEIHLPDLVGRYG